MSEFAAADATVEQSASPRPEHAPPLRVLFCLPYLTIGGVELSTLRLIRNLDPQRFDVTLLVHIRQGGLVDSVPSNARVVFCFDDEPRWPPRRYLLLLHRTIRAARGHDLLVAAMEGRTAFIIWLSGLILRLPVMGWIRTDWSVFKDHVGWRYRASMCVLRKMKRVLSVTQGAADAVTNLCRVDPARLTVVHNGHDLAHTLAQAAEAPLPQDAAWLGDRTIVAVGRLAAVKGHDVLLRAFSLVLQHEPEAKLVIAGDGVLRDDLVQLARELAVDQRVHFAGHCENPFALMSRCAVFALSSRVEGCANVLIEAMACGAPIVATDCPSGPREVLQDGRVGILTPMDDPTAMAEALVRVLRDASLQAELSECGRRRARDFQLHTWVNAISRVMEETRWHRAAASSQPLPAESSP